MVLPAGWEDLGAKGLVVLFVLMIFLGWMIPKRSHDREIKAKDDIIADKNQTIRVQRKTIEELTQATQNLAIPANTAATALRSIAKEAEKKAGDET